MLRIDARRLILAELVGAAAVTAVAAAVPAAMPVTTQDTAATATVATKDTATAEWRGIATQRRDKVAVRIANTKRVVTAGDVGGGVDIGRKKDEKSIKQCDVRHEGIDQRLKFTCSIVKKR